MPNAAKPAVLATRPTPQLSELSARLEQAGYSPLLMPLIEIVADDLANPRDLSLRGKLLDLDLYSHVIFVSRNAARIGIDMIDQLWPQLPVGITWYAIGKGTAQELALLDIDSITNQGLDSEALLNDEHLQDVDGQRILIIKGEGGRTLLTKTLEQRGASVETLDIYQRKMPAFIDQELDKLCSTEIDAILITSGEAIQNFATISDQLGMFANTLMIVPSDRVAKIGFELGFTDIMVAKGADDLSMVEALNLRFKRIEP